MPPPLPIRPAPKRADEESSEPKRCVPSRMELSGFRVLCKVIGTMRCAFSTRAHAAAYLIEIAKKVREVGGHLPAKWEDGVLHRLKHEGPTRLLRHLTALAVRYRQ